MTTKQRIPWTQIAGKTISKEMSVTSQGGGDSREGVMLVFTDDTYAVIWARGDDAMLFADELIEPHSCDLVAAGILTLEEATAINDRKRKEQELALRTARLAMYERLRAEFEITNRS